VLKKRIEMVSARLGDATPGVSEPALAVSVSLDQAQLGSVPNDTPVFVLARDGAGPPVAVVRRSVADLPFTVTLTDANAMLPSRRLSNFDSVEVVARVALGGSPTVQSGDIFGATRVSTARAEPIDIVMNELAP
jgi:cytochrome c-type biogenesis protein CcmH